MITNKEAQDTREKLISTFQNSAHALPVFREIKYPAPVETIADNHPVYVNGTRLINGKPFLSGNKTDSSRIEEFTKLGFSRQYIQELTDGGFHSYYFGIAGIKGKKCNYGSSLPYKPSYTKITSETILHDPDNYDVLHKIEIIDHKVYFNGREIASAPVKGDNGKKKTLAQQLTFCKAVVYAIIPGDIQKPVKNHSSGCTVYESVPDDDYFRELIAQYPAVPTEPIQGQTIDTEEIALPDELNAYTHEAITGYPETSKTIESVMSNKHWLEIDDREIATTEIKRDFEEDIYPMGSNFDSISLEEEYNKGEVEQLYNLLNPVKSHNPANIIRSWFVPHLRLTITEEVIA